MEKSSVASLRQLFTSSERSIHIAGIRKEEEKFLKRGRSSVQPPKKPIITNTEKTRTVYMAHRTGKLFRFVECGATVENADGTLHVFLDRMPLGGWNGHLLARSDNTRPTVRDIPASTPFDDDAMLTAEASGVLSH